MFLVTDIATFGHFETLETTLKKATCRDNVAIFFDGSRVKNRLIGPRFRKRLNFQHIELERDNKSIN